MTLDDSLILHASKPADRSYLSVSALKLYAEDPYRFYLTRVLGLKEPSTTALVLGSALHEAMEVFFRTQSVRAAGEALCNYVASNFHTLDEPVIRVNVDQPHNPRDKSEVEVNAGTLAELGLEVLLPVLQWMESRPEEYEWVAAQASPPQAVERPLGQLSREAGLPYTIMSVYDHRKSRTSRLPVSVLAGVPFHGYVDAVLEVNGSRMILDHKLVSSIVAYYPARGGWVSYGPRYDPAEDLQLDIYSAATGIYQAGFQFFSKFPQYFPPDKPLHSSWMDYRIWKNNPDPKFLPYICAELDGFVRYVLVWRPEIPFSSVANEIKQRAFNKIRDLSEQLTESFILLKDGVEPEIAFPPGNPADLHKKSCPFCVFRGDSCHVYMDREDIGESYLLHSRLTEQREILCGSHPQIQERRALWKQYRQDNAFATIS
ncbi:MAG: hypothetical protein D6800_06650 [Candidatus Zixiibacteriota bacterium]|nr:MAG: hypothetical protein D6800_06650 [candidate division Zixibacteria bacterium]